MTAGKPLSHRRANRVALAAAMLLGLAVSAQAEEEKRPTIRIGSSQLEPADWVKLEGWAEDDHLAAFTTFMASCKPILRAGPSARPERPVFRGLHQACQAAAEAKPADAKAAREFFEQNFRPVRITPAGETAGFLTGFYEPIVDGSREPTDEYVHPLYRTPGGLLRGGKRLKAASFGRKVANAAKAAKGKATKVAKKLRKGGRKLVAFYDRAAIDDGVLKGRNLEICYLKDPIDSFFIHIQGSARVRLASGGMMRVNYESQNGHAYTAVGRFLIERKIYTKEEMSMDRIRQWMTANPDEGNALRRLNKSYVFFRETGLAENEEAIGAQGVSLTPGRSIAVDRNLHVYGTPFFIQAELPIESEAPTTKFRRLMVAQDTGGAIVGPARADIYLGAGDEAGLISGRFKHPGQFVMLFPNSIDPFPVTREVPLPLPRPTDIPQDEEPKQKPELVAAKQPDVKQPDTVPLPVARPELKKPDVVAARQPEPVAPAAAKPEIKKPEAKKPEAKKPETKKPEVKEAKKPDAAAKTKTASAKTTNAKLTEPKAAESKPAAAAAKPAAKKKPEPKSTETKKPKRDLDPSPPS